MHGDGRITCADFLGDLIIIMMMMIVNSMTIIIGMIISMIIVNCVTIIVKDDCYDLYL